MYIIAWVLIVMPASPDGRGIPVQLDKFKTQEECVQHSNKLREQAKGKHSPMFCIAQSRTK